MKWQNENKATCFFPSEVVTIPDWISQTYFQGNRDLRHSPAQQERHMSRLMTKPSKWHVRPAKTQISLSIRPVWSEPSLSAWRKFRSLAIHWAHSEDSDQTGRMPRLIWVFAGRTVTLLVLSCRGSFSALGVSVVCTTRDPRPVSRNCSCLPP